ncbi:uncharacterized protein KY384_004913 [Bacidia gigantensis]|uniref:uncharacterized protein n=1 Tax=Bacidia gigantensis TaxID=2732470 RepID=UPI001D054066|nr:uncharacterized protein KY384_004913 [Bacidia gigantensis]KAG8530411.1 hypothetical protein KY384_004913 [Bacidia gigantensis]
MPVIGLEKLIALQQKADDIRNVCILAHVDHGKTSLTDALIATNGIISPKMAGKIRYLDSRPDEQLRGITMESSAISLYFSMLRRSAPDTPPVEKEYLINLIDSPGHVDFSSEVSTASRLCDGALVLVDAVEGVCSQTVTVLRQTWTEKLRPVLVINKVDRLITELRLSAAESYSHLSKLIEQVNAVIGTFFQGERMEEDLQWREKIEQKAAEATEKRAALAGDMESIAPSSTTGEFEEKGDEDLYFSPEKNNVIFSSAVDGWAFTVRQFASMYEKKLGIKRSVLEKVLWGDYYLEPKTRRVLGSKHLKGRALKPMFVQLVLDSIWAVYNATMSGTTERGDPTLLEKITTSLSLKIPSHVLRSKDNRAILTNVFSSWLPVSTAVLVSAIEYLPGPRVSQAERLPSLIDVSPGASAVDPQIRDAMINSKATLDGPFVAYISKMVAVRESELPKYKKRAGQGMTGEEARDLARKKRMEIQKTQLMMNAGAGAGADHGVEDISEPLEGMALNGSVVDEEEDPEHLVGFARTYSGSLSVGDSIYVLPPKFSPNNPHAAPKPQRVAVTGLYLMMGRGLEILTSVPPGVVCGIAGLEGLVLKSATLCSKLEGAVNLAGLSMGTQPIVRVALEPVNPADLDKMIQGMKLLEQSDPCARYELLSSGEHVILTAGELHLERCLKDLRERFARCDIQAGEPIVPYRETIASSAEMTPLKDKDLPRGTIISDTNSRQITLRLRTVPLPVSVTTFLEKNVASIRRLYAEQKAQQEKRQASAAEHQDESDEELEQENESAEVNVDFVSVLEFREKLRTAFAEANAENGMWNNVVDKIAAFGPRRIGPNILVDATPEGTCQRFLRENDTQNRPQHLDTKAANRDLIHPRELSDKVSYAFQLATAQGPMCHEPIQGIAVFLESLTINSSSDNLPYTTITPSIDANNTDISYVPHATPSAPSTANKDPNIGRLTGEILKLTTSAIHTSFLSWSPRLMLSYYSCTIQTHPDVLGRTYSTLSRLHATITSESMAEGTPFYSITALLPLATSFNIAGELMKNPYWVPRSEEELEDFGEKGDRERWSKVLLDRVRRRKGLIVKGERVVKEGEKQKTLKK